MEFSKKKLPASKLEIEVTIPAAEVEAKTPAALSALKKEVVMEGFRQGHVPEGMVKERVGKEQLFAKAVELSIQEAYRAVLKEENPEVLGEPEIRIAQAEQGKPLRFYIHLSLFPEILLPDYKKIASGVEKKEAKVEPGETERTLQWLQESRKKEDGTLPELTDEFAKELGNFPDAVKLKENVEEGLLLEKQLAERNRVRQEIVEKIAKEAKLEVPDVLVKQEQEALLEQTRQGVKQMLQMDFAEYLQQVKKTEEEVKASLLSQAESRIKQFLVVNEIARKEGIAPTPEEIEAETQKVLGRYPDQKAAEGQFDPAELKLYSEGVAKNEKTLQFLEQFSS
ncbi:MAG: trigger factor [bacterium]|nr:trigger factor [bacterium]